MSRKGRNANFVDLFRIFSLSLYPIVRQDKRSLAVCALKINNTLKELYLGENNLTPNDGAHLYQLISGNRSLELLDLRHNNLQVRLFYAKTYYECVLTRKTLQDTGMAHICDALRDVDACTRGKLTTLVLWNNRFTPAAMQSLDRALVSAK